MLPVVKPSADGSGASIPRERWRVHTARAAALVFVFVAVGHRWGVPPDFGWIAIALALIAIPPPSRAGVMRLRERLTTFPRRRPAVAICLISHVLVFAIALVTVRWIGVIPEPGRFRVSKRSTWNIPARWDAGWYLGIANHGYAWSQRGLREQQPVAFFPAFPLTLRYVGDVASLPAKLIEAPRRAPVRSDVRTLWAGVAVSIIFHCIACAFLFALARQYLDHRAALLAVALSCVYPFAVFFSVPYTESMFLMCVTGLFYYGRRRQIVLASLCALLAGFTRSNGFLVAAAYACDLADRRYRRGERLSWSDVVPAIWPLVAVGIYSTFVYRLSGRPFAWAEAQQAWNNTLNPFEFLVWHTTALAEQGIVEFVGNPSHFLSVCAVALTLGSVWPLAKRFSWGFAAFALLCVLPPLLWNLQAIGRMTSVVFPMFIWLAAWARTPARLSVAAACSLAGLTLCAITFFRWGPLI